MSAVARYDADAVRAALTGDKILAHFGREGRGTREVRLKECPVCRLQQRRPAVRVNAETADFLHHSGPGGAGPCRGDCFDLIGALAGIDTRSRFPEVVELGAQIGGVSPDMPQADVDRVVAEYRSRMANLERRAAEERARGEALIPDLWEHHRIRDNRGEDYLHSRGLDAEVLRDRGDVVRFDQFGNPCILIRNFATGKPINIARRLLKPLPDGTNKLTLALWRVLGVPEDDKDSITGGLSTCGSLVGDVSHAAWNGCGISILTEGIMDSLAAVIAYSGCTIVGSNGVGNMHHVAAAVAPHVVKARGVLLIGVHRDEQKQGIHASAQAVRAAVQAGLEMRTSVRAIEIGHHKDLCDAWYAGWRGQWNGVTA